MTIIYPALALGGILLARKSGRARRAGRSRVAHARRVRNCGPTRCAACRRKMSRS